MVAAFWFVALMMSATRCSGDFIVQNPITSSTTRYATSSFRYLSLHDGNTHSNYPAVFVQAENLCEPTRALVAGKIVVATFGGDYPANCWPDDAARRFKKLGAIAFVVLARYNPPGMISNIHWTLEPEKEGAGLPVVDVALVDIGNKEFEMWQTSSMSGFSATLTPEHIRVYQETFESPLWVLLMQILLPCCALVVTADCVCELTRQFFASRKGAPTIIITSVEAASCFAIAVALAFGEYGPLVLTSAFHYFFLALLAGPSFFTTIILALVINEKARTLKGLPERQVMTYYRRSIAASAIVFIGWDVVVGALIAYEPSVAYGSFASFAGIYGVGQGLIDVYFFMKARALKQPLLAYLHHPESNPRPENSARVARVAFWLNASGASMLLGTASFLFIGSLLTSLFRVEGGSIFFCAVFLFSASRIATAYCQVSLSIHESINQPRYQSIRFSLSY